jgi:hypothetical protein
VETVSFAQSRSAGALLSTALACALLILAGPHASVAAAGDYHVYSCRTPSGEVAPVDGWSGSIAEGSAPDDYAKDTCAEGGGLVAGLGDQTSHQSFVDIPTWEFVSPAGAAIVGATLWRSGYLHGRPGEEATYEFWLAGSAEGSTIEDCVFTQGCGSLGDAAPPLAATNAVVVPPANLGAHLYVRAACDGARSSSECGGSFADPNGYAAAVWLYAADITLEQAAGPSAANVSGELASAPVVAGTSDVAFSASDPGSGVYEALFSIDGQVVQRTIVNSDGGRCRSVGTAADGTPAFLYLQPCLGSVSADVGFDTTHVANGVHRLLVSVIDAAGNAAPVLDRSITIANASAPGPPNGVNASAQAKLAVRWTRTKNESLTSGFGQRQIVSGRLLAATGAPISGAQIAVIATPTYPGAKPTAMPSVETGPDGRFSVRVPAGVSSRTLRFAYSSRLGSSPPVATRTLTLKVRAGISLTIAPRTASVGRSISFHGRLRGGPVPAEGKQLVLEARSPGSRWLEFDVVRTSASGRFHARYRFKFPGPAKYQFRVLSEPESDYPFTVGASRVLNVREL